ncbi:anti-phage protein KwaA [uncultured Shewanella sp.]|uniref:anti-phage protein KwaA n=1 Tax=uncultured Shewanella sp. TaxID=173975 RepID=UPI0026050997|nr:anti-phage protein KwaA [uncultured Shewanella sp.]
MIETMTHKKIGLYIISIALLFVFIFVLKVDVPICYVDGCKFIGVSELFKKNIIPIICLICLFWALIEYKKFRFDLQGSTNIPFKIKRIECVNYEHLTFLATYVIPLVSFNFDSERYLIVLGVLLVVMGVIYVKTDLFYANPSLALFGFHIYKVDGSFKNNEMRGDIILISLSKLSNNDNVSYIKIDDRIYYGEKVRE